MLSVVIMFLALEKTSLRGFKEKATEEDRKQKEKHTNHISFNIYLLVFVLYYTKDLEMKQKVLLVRRFKHTVIWGRYNIISFSMKKNKSL